MHTTLSDALARDYSAIRQAGCALILAAVPVIFLSIACVFAMDPSSIMPVLFLVVVAGAVFGILSATLALCITTHSQRVCPRGRSDGNLQAMVVLSTIASVFYCLGSAAVSLSHISELYSGAACDLAYSLANPDGNSEVRCAVRVHQFMSMDVVMALAASFCHVALAKLGHRAKLAQRALAALGPTEKTCLASCPAPAHMAASAA